MRLPFGPAHDAGEFIQFAPLLGFVAGRDRLIDAVRDMIGEDFFLRATQRGADSAIRDSRSIAGNVRASAKRR